MLHERARLLNVHGGSTARYVYRLATIDDVVVVIGPEVEFTDQINAIGIVDVRIWVVAAGAVHTVASDLTLDTVDRLPAACSAAIAGSSG